MTFIQSASCSSCKCFTQALLPFRTFPCPPSATEAAEGGLSDPREGGLSDPREGGLSELARAALDIAVWAAPPALNAGVGFGPNFRVQPLQNK